MHAERGVVPDFAVLWSVRLIERIEDVDGGDPSIGLLTRERWAIPVPFADTTQRDVEPATRKLDLVVQCNLFKTM
jgi:hypothetical protein